MKWEERNNLRSIFNMLHWLIIVDRDAKIMDVNNAFLKMIGKDIEFVNDKYIGDGIGCENSFANGCGNALNCLECPLRTAIENVMNTAELLLIEVPYSVIIVRRICNALF
jgi:PAS domain-containing protein